MTSIAFTKMHGLGNDFVIINTTQQTVDLSSLPIAKLADRHLGIGFDQLIVIEPGTEADFFCRIYNADGSEAEQCGNGLRCAARLLQQTGSLSSTSVRLQTSAGIFPAEILEKDQVRIALGHPEVDEALVELPLDPTLIKAAALKISGTSSSIAMSLISLGNPHAIIKVDSTNQVALELLAPMINAHPRFAHGVNIGFMQVLSPRHIRLRTFERGVGETNACGSNACAAVAAGIMNGWLDAEVTVEFRYGNLTIGWHGGIQPMIMTGPTTTVYSGEII